MFGDKLTPSDFTVFIGGTNTLLKLKLSEKDGGILLRGFKIIKLVLLGFSFKKFKSIQILISERHDVIFASERC